MDKKTNEIIEKQYVERMQTFKPIFGDLNHIRIVRLAGDIAEKEKSLKDKISAAKGVPKLEKDIHFLKSRALGILKQL